MAISGCPAWCVVRELGDYRDEKDRYVYKLGLQGRSTADDGDESEVVVVVVVVVPNTTRANRISTTPIQTPLDQNKQTSEESGLHAQNY